MTGGMQSLHPLVVFAYYAGLGLLCMLLFHPYFLGIALLLLISQAFMLDEHNTLRKWAVAYTVIGITILLWNPVFSHRGTRVLFYIWDTPIVWEAIIFGFTMMLLVLCILVLFVNYNALIGSLKFIYLFARFAPKTTVMIAMATRFVPLLRSRLSEVTNVQRTRGFSVNQGGWNERLRSGMRLLQATLVWSLEESMHTADALAAKGYGSRKRSTYAYYRMDSFDSVVIALMLLCLLVCIYLWFRGYGVLAIYPALAVDWMGTSMVWMQLFVFISYLMIPIIVEIRGRLLWRSWK
jgi:energy-coupling factor transport system permease protein